MVTNKFKKFIVSMAGLGVFYSIFFLVISLTSQYFPDNYLRNRSNKICEENVIASSYSDWTRIGNVTYTNNSIILSSGSILSWSYLSCPKIDEFSKYPKYLAFSSTSLIEENSLVASAYIDGNKIQEESPTCKKENLYEIFFYNDFTNIEDVALGYSGANEIEISNLRFSYLKDISYGG